jgi:Mce-associated membrane protein
MRVGAMAAEVNDEAISEVLAELAEAEAAEAEARAEAARATATAARLRGSKPADEDVAVAEALEDTEDTEADDDTEVARRRLWSRIGWSKFAAAVAVVVICGLLTVTGLMIWQHQKDSAQRAHRAELVAAARAGVTALLSIDYNRAKADVQHVIDLSTGSFKDDFSKGADDFVKTAEQSKAVTVGSIKSAALERENGDTGVVLLAASSTVTNANGAHQDPRAWRMSVTVARDGDQFKMSNVEFVP